jgi:L-lactate dehydrogenase complex protein LldG
VNARDEVLARVRAALAGATDPVPVPRGYRRTGTSDRAALVAQLADRLADYRAAVHRTAPGGLPATVARVLAGTTTLVGPADLPEPWLSAYSGVVRRDQPPVPVTDLDAPGVSVLTGCALAIAETGTIVLDTGPTQGRRVLTLVPDHHVCVVRAEQIVATVPEALARLLAPAGPLGRAEVSPAQPLPPTRPLTFISGPSATSDIELDRIEGVHGPRRLDVIITRKLPGPTSQSAHL